MIDYYAVACPTCKEPKGFYCKRKNSLPSVAVHAARRRAADRIVWPRNIKEADQ